MKTMRLRVFAAILTICGPMSINAQFAEVASGKLSPGIRKVMAQHKFPNAKFSTLTDKVCAFVKFKSDDAEGLLNRYDCEKVTQIGDIYIARIPVARLEAMAAANEVERIETQTGGRMMNDLFPQWVHTDNIYAGKRLPQAYDGTGVLLGIVDGGFDVTHPSFYAEDGTTYRIKGFVDCFYDENETRGVLTPIGREYTTEDDILGNLHVGDTENYHGTHTLGTAAGSGYGSPYRGVAYGADIFAVTTKNGGEHYCNTAEQAACMKRIFDYADQTEQPCVISYSIGFDDIPGDSQLFREALQSMLGPGRILVVSAGNSGTRFTYVHKPSRKESAGAGVPVSVPAEFYLTGEQPFRLKCFACKLGIDYATMSAKYTLVDSVTLETEALPADSVEMRGHHIFLEREGTFYTFHDRWEDTGLGDFAVLAFVIEGEEADVQAYVGGASTFARMSEPLMKDARFGVAESSHNIGMPGTLPEVITVGAVNGRKMFVNSEGETIESMGNDSPLGLITAFSSTGPTFTGLTKPDVVAPGANVISAGNSFYGAGFGQYQVTTTTFNGREYPWVAFSGTSMAAPAVAGIVALWLQADPTLTPDRVKEIISQTSRKPDETMEYPNNIYGYGLIDAYAGMLKLLGIATAIPDISSRQPSALRIQPTAQGVRLLFDSAPTQPFSVSVYTVSGQQLFGQSIQPDSSTSYDIALPVRREGVCVVQVNSIEPGVTGSELIR